MGSEEELGSAGEGEAIIRTHCIKKSFLIKEKSNCKNKGIYLSDKYKGIFKEQNVFEKLHNIYQ